MIGNCMNHPERAIKSYRHKCWEGGWAVCTACLGRLHHVGCTGRRDKEKDCCAARHKMLFKQGHTRGLDDSSVVMWCPELWGNG